MRHKRLAHSTKETHSTKDANAPQEANTLHKGNDAPQEANTLHKGNTTTKVMRPLRQDGHLGKNTTKDEHTLYEIETPERTQTDALNAMAKNTTKMPKFFSPKLQQS